MGLPRPTYVPIGYVPELTRIAPAPEDIDVLFYGALSERRYAVLRDLHDRGLRVKWLLGAFGASRDAWIARSKIVINVHYWEAKIFEIARVSYLLANRRAVVSERGADPTLERDWSPASRSRTTTDWSIAVWSSWATSARDASSPSGATRLSPLAARPPFCSARWQASRVSPTRPLRGTTLHRCAPRRQRPQRRSAAPHPNCSGIRLSTNAIVAGQGRTQPRGCAVGLFLAETYFQLDDFVNARKWYARRVEMGGYDEEVYWAMFRLAQSMRTTR